MAIKYKKLVAFIAFSFSLTGCDFFICSSEDFVNSLKSCSTYKCTKPMMGISYKVEKDENNVCSFKLGFMKGKQFMACKANISELQNAHKGLSLWAFSDGDKEVTYNFKKLDIEYFVNGKSIGRPYNELIQAGKCEYTEKP